MKERDLNLASEIDLDLTDHKNLFNADRGFQVRNVEQVGQLCTGNRAISLVFL